MKRLLEGVARFRETSHDGVPWDPATVVQGQSPEAVLITCGDSRVVPHLFMDAGVGDLFVLRNAGNLVPSADSGSSEEASLAFAVEELGIPHIIVCGHTECGAVKSVAQGYAGDPALVAWLGKVCLSEAANASMLEHVRANVVAQLGRLDALPVVRNAIERDELMIHGWVYDIATGQISSYVKALGIFAPLSSIAHEHEDIDALC